MCREERVIEKIACSFFMRMEVNDRQFGFV